MAGAALTIKGGPELRARLEATASAQTRVTFLREWQNTTTRDMRSHSPRRTGQGHGSIKPGFVSQTKAYVMGAFWLIFIDRGTKAHDIRPQSISHGDRSWITSVQPGGPEKGYGNPKALAQGGHGTVFGKKVHRRRMARRPFITNAAQQALKGHLWRDEILKAWNRKHEGRFSGGKTTI